MRKFHLEEWMNYYKARLDEDNLKEVRFICTIPNE